jgi:hypothetical protein
MKFRTATLLAITTLLAIPLVGFAYLGTFTRMHADDFCQASDTIRMGLWPSVIFWYNTWSGRFSFFIASHLFSYAGPTGAAVFPAILITVWWLGLAWALLPILRKSGWFKPRLMALASSALILFILLVTVPNLFQSVLWQDGQINYSFPLVGLSLLSGVLLRAWLEPAWPTAVYAGLAFVLALILGGFTEIYDTTQVALLALVLGLALLLSARANRGRLGLVLGAALAGAVIALAIVVLAPGNLGRQSAAGQTTSLARVIPLALRNGLALVERFLALNRWWALASLLTAFLTGWWLDPAPAKPAARLRLSELWSQAWFRGLILLPLSALLLTVAACAPTAFALNSDLDDRSIIIPQGLLIAAMLFSGALLAVGLRRIGLLPAASAHPFWGRALPIAILAAVLLLSGASMRSTLQQAPDFQAYAQSWDKRAAILLDGRRQGQTDITVVGLNNRFGVADLRVEPDYWVNGCMASYYGFTTIRGR